MKSFHGRTQSACGAHMFLISVNGELWGNDEVMLVHWTGSNKRLVLSKWFQTYSSPAHIDKHTHIHAELVRAREDKIMVSICVSLYTLLDNRYSKCISICIWPQKTFSVRRFFSWSEEEKQKEAWSSAIFMRSLWKMREERDRQTHPSSQKKIKEKG